MHPTRALPYYGWFVLAASAVCEMLVVGATSYAAGLFVLPLQAEFGLSRADASSSLLLLNLGAVFLASFAGRALDRYPIRLVMCAGAVCFAAGMGAIALTASLPVMAVALVLPAALGFALLGPMTTATLASRWFFRRRGLALGIAAIATSGGGFFVVPLLSKAIENYGWRDALMGEASLVLVTVIALALLVLKDNPFRAGLAGHPENKGRTDGALLSDGATAGGRALLPWRKILGSRGFWAPTLLLAAVSGVAQAIVITAPPYGHQLGFTVPASAFLISAFSLSAALTKILAGLMADFLSARILLFISTLFIAMSMALLWLFASYDMVLLACALAGVSLGGTIPTCAALIAARFGAPHFGSVIGWTYVLIFGCTILMVRFMGTMFDLTQGYHGAFAALFGFALTVWAIALVIDLRVPEVSATDRPFH